MATDRSRDETGSALQRTSGGRGGWRLPALLLAGLLIGMVVVARLGMEPDQPPSGQVATLPPVVTPSPDPAPPAMPGSPTQSPATREPVRLGPGPSQVWAGRYVDGIPLHIHDELVRRVDDVLARPPSGSVFVGGWYIGPACGRLGHAGYCPEGRIADSPADAANSERSTRLRGAVPVASAGPAIFSATVERACPTGEACRTTINVEEAVWLGDPLTDTGPIEVVALLASLSYAFPTLDAVPVQERPDCPVLPPAQAYRSTGGGVHQILAFPTTDDREAADGRIRVGQRVMVVEEGGECRLPAPQRGDATWIAQDNVLLLVDATRPLTAELARAALDDARAQSFGEHAAAARPITVWQALSALWRADTGLALVPPWEQVLDADGLPEATWMVGGADVRVLAVFPTRRARRALDTATLPRSTTVLGEPDARLRWIGVQNVLLGVSGPPEVDARLRELLLAD